MFEQPKTRREFLRFLSIGAIRTGAVVAINAGGFGVQILRTRGNKKDQEQEFAKSLEEAKDLRVKYFAKEVLDAGKRISSYTNVDDMVAVIAGWYAGDALGGYLLRNRSDIVERLVGVAGFAGGKAIDIISTIIAADQMSDTRFKEYGLGVYIGEKNPLLPHNPTRREIIGFGLIQTPFVLMGGLALPFIGRGYAGASPFIARNNIEVAHIINTSMKLGDETKVHIENGRDETFIRNFLATTESLSKKQESESETL
ncbi:hypothetical protein A2W45_01585 [Candidatus Curtissbacteria bacterium RIFCSPHIGHO2_12_41_11]|nr:MAG: hypothetical protein A2W45_01585 [Candidatus Curtissbacteria bacterium RIFCSPHIGHO2_12_41_11]